MFKEFRPVIGNINFSVMIALQFREIRAKSDLKKLSVGYVSEMIREQKDPILKLHAFLIHINVRKIINYGTITIMKQ